MSAICVERWMRLHVPTFSPFCGLMCQDPLLIREKLFQGIDKDYNVVDMGIVSEVIGELEAFHITKEALEATRLGKHINELRRKSSDRLLANRAKSLVKKWRALLSGPETGPPPGGGNNNNSLAATNGNTSSRLNSAVVGSPALQRSNISPGLPRNTMSPGLPMRNNISPGLPMRNNLSPGMRNNLSPGIRPSMTPGMPVRPGSIPNSLSGGFRSARGSPSVSRSATPRVSPATVTISSSGSSPNNSRPSSPHIFRPINPPGPSLPNSRSPSPDIEIIDEVVKTPRMVAANHKRMRREDSDVRLENKRPKLDFGHQTQNLNGTDGIARDGVISSSDKASLANRPKKIASRPGSENKNMLNKQITMAKRSGKVKTTSELLENLGIESRHVVSPPVPHNVNNLVPKENKEELMNRFFESQLVHLEDDEDAVQVISRPPTAAGDNPSSTSNSRVSSRVQTPAAVPATQSVEDVLAQLPPIDPAAVLAEWEARMEEEEEIEGLIPAFKPRMEITEKVIQDLNEGQLEYIGGVMNHVGEFREWHEMASKETINGEILHVLPYSLID